MRYFFFFIYLYFLTLNGQYTAFVIMNYDHYSKQKMIEEFSSLCFSMLMAEVILHAIFFSFINTDFCISIRLPSCMHMKL